MFIRELKLYVNRKGRDKSNESTRSTGTWRAPIGKTCVLAGGHDERERRVSARVPGGTHASPREDEEVSK